MSAVQHAHIGIGQALLRLMQGTHIGGNPVCLQGTCLGVKIQRLPVIVPDGGEPFFQPPRFFSIKALEAAKIWGAER